jgi:hypothetical protein
LELANLRHRHISGNCVTICGGHDRGIIEHRPGYRFLAGPHYCAGYTRIHTKSGQAGGGIEILGGLPGQAGVTLPRVAGPVSLGKVHRIGHVYTT